VTGPILVKAALPVDDGVDAAQVRRRLAPLERELLADAVRAIAGGRSA
jgi:folate-dependent phosphoribosylglycinamide formyltransferase PurN